MGDYEGKAGSSQKDKQPMQSEASVQQAFCMLFAILAVLAASYPYHRRVCFDPFRTPHACI